MRIMCDEGGVPKEEEEVCTSTSMHVRMFAVFLFPFFWFWFWFWLQQKIGKTIFWIFVVWIFGRRRIDDDIVIIQPFSSFKHDR
jgi:hypothetical protein